MTTPILKFDEFKRVFRSVERKGVHGVMRVFDDFAFNPSHMTDSKALLVMEQRINWGLSHKMDGKLRSYLKEQQRAVQTMRRTQQLTKVSMALAGCLTTGFIAALLAVLLVG